MGKYQKKPVVIEAWQLPMDWTGERGSWELLPMWMVNGTVVANPDHPLSLFIITLEGTMKADPGDWIIRGVQGELYPCKPDIFAATYDPAGG